MKVNFNHIKKDFYIDLFQGHFWAFLGIFIAFLFLPKGVFAATSEPICNGQTFEFAAKWTSECRGWFKELAIMYCIGALLHWISYCGIAISVYLRHPVMANDKTSKRTVNLTAAFIFGCGAGHLIAAYVVFHPVYYLETWFLILNGSISYIAHLYVKYGLIKGAAKVKLKESYLNSKSIAY